MVNIQLSYLRKKLFHLETINSEMNKFLKEELATFHKMIIFDMGRYNIKGAILLMNVQRKFGFFPMLDDLRAKEKDPIILTKRIGLMLKGKTIDDMLNVVDDMAIIEDIKKVIKELKRKNYFVGIHQQ
jgi:hypothetical protein